jgi:hypothetical protein
LKTNFVLIDFENVQPKNLGVLEGRSFKIKVFTGANQSKAPMEMVRALQPFGSDAEYVAIAGSGKNSLDFHITYYMGRLAAENPGSSFYVISKDKGFDSLIKHIKAQGVSCQRSSTVAEIPGVRTSSSKSVSNTVNTVKAPDPRSIPEKVDAVIKHLAKLNAAKPRTLKTLRSVIKQVFMKNGVADAELEEIIRQLTERGTIKIADGKMNYELPA